MSTTLLRSSFRSALRAHPSVRPASLTTLSSTRSKATLPDLPYDYGALEPAISGQIMELHHSKHHQTYVTSFNTCAAQLASAQASSDLPAQIALQPLLNFHGGGHLNHSLFWENLAPRSAGGGEPPVGALAKALDGLGGVEGVKAGMTRALAGVQGSGWVWLVKERETGRVGWRTYANQDPVVGPYVPLLGIDAWEHAYYLQYQNRKAEYFSAIWDVVNWKTVEKRFEAC